MEYPVRVLCVLFGVIDLIGIFWHQESMQGEKILVGTILAICELSIGLISAGSFINKCKQYIYLAICVIGAMCTIYFILQALNISYGANWFAVVIRLIFLVFFIWLLNNARKNKNNRGQTTI